MGLHFRTLLGGVCVGWIVSALVFLLLAPVQSFSWTVVPELGFPERPPKGYFCTGWQYSDTIVVTAAHCGTTLDERVLVKFQDNEIRAGRVFFTNWKPACETQFLTPACDMDGDVALVSLDTQRRLFLTLSARNPEIGAEVAVRNHEHVCSKCTNETVVTGYHTFPDGEQFSLQDHMEGGASGSPVLLNDLYVVGMVSKTVAGVTFCTTAAAIRRALTKAGIR